MTIDRLTLEEREELIRRIAQQIESRVFDGRPPLGEVLVRWHDVDQEAEEILSQRQPPEPVDWQPGEGDELWWLAPEFTVDGTVFWNHPWQVKMLEAGNCYQTREEATRASQYIRAVMRAGRIHKRIVGSWTVERKNGSYGCAWIFPLDAYRVPQWATGIYHPWHFKTIEQAEQFRAELGDDDLHMILTGLPRHAGGGEGT